MATFEDVYKAVIGLFFAGQLIPWLIFDVTRHVANEAAVPIFFGMIFLLLYWLFVAGMYGLPVALVLLVLLTILR